MLEEIRKIISSNNKEKNKSKKELNLINLLIFNNKPSL